MEEIEVGDRLLTRDHGYQPVRWVGRRTLGADVLSARPHLRPVRIRQGALGDGLPRRDLTISPQHRMLIRGPRAALLFGEDEALVCAQHLTSLPGVSVLDVDEVTYIHLMCDRHEVIRAEGAWSESLLLGEEGLKSLEPGQKAELLEIFEAKDLPELAASFPAARPILKAYEARLLLADWPLPIPEVVIDPRLVAAAALRSEADPVIWKRAG